MFKEWTRSNIQKVIKRDIKKTAKRLDYIRRGCEYYKLRDMAVRIALDPEYLHRTYPMFKHYASRRTDREHVIYELEKLPTNGCGKRSVLIQQCLKHLDEKGCFANKAVEAVFQNPERAWDVIGGCNWERTNGRQLADMLSAG